MNNDGTNKKRQLLLLSRIYELLFYILTLRVTPTSPYGHGGVQGGWREAPAHRHMRRHVQSSAVGLRGVAAEFAPAGCARLETSRRSRRAGLARYPGETLPARLVGVQAHCSVSAACIFVLYSYDPRCVLVVERRALVEASSSQ